ncbi:N-acetyl sugar amidotransferase [Candidatus Amoebophilus asiaticus]|nr:N-acetyl sugar amidotransferase [Candidatus Amoebophilus asiaticus]
MDNIIHGFYLDENGICNNCHLFDEIAKEYPHNEVGQAKLQRVIEKIKKQGKNKKYDCVVGVSGGTDSTYVLYLIVKKYGLRPLAVHFDNGWNSEIAVSNIKNAVEILGVDLYTYVVDWEEFKDIHLAFLKASVPDVEVVTDIGIRKVLYETTAKHGLKYFIYGNCFWAEGIVPHSWGYKDGRYVKGVHKIFGKVKMKTYPNLYLSEYLFYAGIKRIKILRLLNYFDYVKDEAKEVLKKEVGWKDYGGHHHESIFTRFYQSYLSPVKFKMEHRKATYSALVRVGKMSREEAIEELKENPYINGQFQEDKEYISKKLGITDEEFNEILSRPLKTFLDYPSYYPLIKKMDFLIRFAYRFKLIDGLFQGGKFTRPN